MLIRKLGRSNIARYNKFTMSTDPVAASGFEKTRRVKAKSLKNQLAVKKQPQIFRYAGTNEEIARIFSSSGERKVARAISIELNKMKLTFKLDICLSVARMFNGVKVRIGKKYYLVNPLLVDRVLKKLIRRKLVQVRKLEKML